MKIPRTVFLALLLFLLNGQCLFSQKTNLVVFSAHGEKFFVLLNGIPQHPAPETNLRIKWISGINFRAKIRFEDKSLPPIIRNLNLKKGTETTFEIRKINNGQYILKQLSQMDIASIPPLTPGQKEVIYQGRQEVVTEVITPSAIAVVPENMENLAVAPEESSSGIKSTTTVTTTTVTTSSTVTTNTTQAVGTIKGKPIYEMPGYSGPVGCPYPMSDLDFKDVKKSIETKSFEDSKLVIAKEVISANCLFASEVKQILDIFSFETTRLEFAKYAYRFTFDQGNYYKLNDAFKFESSVTELNEFIRGEMKNEK